MRKQTNSEFHVCRMYCTFGICPFQFDNQSLFINILRWAADNKLTLAWTRFRWTFERRCSRLGKKCATHIFERTSTLLSSSKSTVYARFTWTIDPHTNNARIEKHACGNARIGVQTNRLIPIYNERNTVLRRWFLSQKAIFAWHRRKCYFISATTTFPFVLSCEARKYKKWGKFAIKALNMVIQKTYLSFKRYLLET